MNILVATRLPGLARALDGAMHDGRHQVTMVSAVTDARRRLDDARVLDVMILDEQIDPDEGEPIQDALWHLMYTGGMRQPAVRPLLVLRDDSFPVHIRDALVGAAQDHGGGAYLLPRWSTPADETQAVQWLMTQLALETLPVQHWITPLSAAGGAGKTTQMGNLALAFARRGLRTLMIDADFANGSMTDWLKVDAGAYEPFVTLVDEHPNPVGAYPLDAVRRRIIPHASGVDLLSSGRGLAEVADMTATAMHALLSAVRRMPYDVVCLDAGPDLKARPYAINVVRDGGIGLIIVQPGRKERHGAETMVRLLSQLVIPERNLSLLSYAALLGVAAEHGSVARIEAVYYDMLRRYTITDLGIVPRDARLISQIAEHDTFVSVFDLAPRSAYCRAIEAAVDRILAWRRIPVAPPPPAAAWWQRLFGRAGQVRPQEAT